MEHKCTVNEEDAVLSKLTWFQKIRLISYDNPLRLSYFRSDVSVREERRRHLEVNKYAIHPFSSFRAWYEVYMVYVYASALITKPLDAGFMDREYNEHHFIYQLYTIVVDFLCWIDIFVNFFTGYELKMNKKVELRTHFITTRYALSPYFIFDMISSIPKCLMYHFPYSLTRKYIIGVVTIMGMSKIVRVVGLLTYFRRSAEFFRMESKGKLFLMCSLIVSLLIIHWMACLQFYIPMVVRRSFHQVPDNRSWFMTHKQNLFEKGITVQYSHCFFRSSAYILSVDINRLYALMLPEEYMLAIFTYIIGKILIGFVWIILATGILNSRLMEITYAEVINQLQEYMRQKQLPLNLRNRILQYFAFKYRNRYFKESLINSLLSENLRKEANLHVCKSLIKNVSLFAELNPMQLSKVVDCLIPEIFLPNDTIIHAGTYGDAMYFLFSGTVAVYTRSGKEICHLQDGAYFGEISLLLKGHLRSATIVALETSQIYRLKKRDFEKNLVTTKAVKQKMLNYAEYRLKEITKLEEEYKEKLFEESFRNVTSHTKH